MTVLEMEAFSRPEPRNVPIATKVTKSHDELIREAVEILKDEGAETTTVSSFVAMAAVTIAKAVKAQREAK